MADYPLLLGEYLIEAEQMFGSKTDYILAKLTYHNHPPQTILHDKGVFEKKNIFIIKLHGQAINDRKDGIFQLSHEVIHLLSPVEQNEGDEVNYLEEGMATYFSKLVTERETGDSEFCDSAMSRNPKYLKAYKLYSSLIEIDVDAVKKLRRIAPIIANIKAEHFAQVELNVDDELINALLTKFYGDSE